MKYSNSEEKLVFSPFNQKARVALEKRIKPNRVREDTHTCPVDVPENLNPFADVFEEYPDAPLIINEARAIVRSWEQTPKIIFENELIVGIARPQFPIMEHFSWGIKSGGRKFKTDDEFIPEEEQSDELKAHFEKLSERMEPLKWSHIIDASDEIIGREKFFRILGDNVFNAGGYQGHTVPSYERLLTKGLDGMLSYIDECEKEHEDKDLYEASRIIVKGMSELLENYSKEAKKLSEESHGEQKKIYLAISENCKKVAHEKPETFYEACQLMWCLCLFDWCDCVGRADRYFLPFYETSKKNGDVFDVEDIAVSLMMKMWENGIHNMTVSGVDGEGNDSTNELTYLFLQILRTIHDTHPRMSVRFHENSPKELYDLVITMWAEGMSDPTVVSDENVIKGLTQLEIPIEDARDYTVLGCQEIEVQGKSNTGCEDGVINLAKVFEYAYNGGKSPDDGMQVGPLTKPFVLCETFEEFMKGYEEQIRFFTKAFLYLCNAGQEIRAANYAKLVKTPFTVGCLEKGAFHDAGGPVYNTGCVETGGVAVVADSMTAIKKLVFEEKLISKETLDKALKANFEGYEKERQQLLNLAPKFGNDNDEADKTAVYILDMFWSEIGKYKSVRGGTFTGACSLLEGGVNMGKSMGAMPDGRFAGEPLGNSIGSRPGADKCGPSALLSSVAKLPLDKGAGGTTLNLVLTAKLLSNENIRDKIAALIKTYLLNGGQMIQITTACVEDLIDAKAHPERHGDLIVRIGGFSIKFVELPSACQDEIITRYA